MKLLVLFALIIAISAGIQYPLEAIAVALILFLLAFILSLSNNSKSNRY